MDYIELIVETIIPCAITGFLTFLAAVYRAKKDLEVAKQDMESRLKIAKIEYDAKLNEATINFNSQLRVQREKYILQTQAMQSDLVRNLAASFIKGEIEPEKIYSALREIPKIQEEIAKLNLNNHFNL